LSLLAIFWLDFSATTQRGQIARDQTNMHFDRHQKIAIGIFLFTAVYVFVRDSTQKALEQSFALLVLLLAIIFYRRIAYYAGFGFPQVWAKDYRSENHPAPYALLFWIIYLLAWSAVFFQ
jgi:hypothetical protein